MLACTSLSFGTTALSHIIDLPGGDSNSGYSSSHMNGGLLC